MTEYRIVPLAAAHIAAVAELERQCFSAPWDEASLLSELENPLSLWLVAISPDGQPLGYVGSQTVLGEADMMNLAVRQECRRQGIARALVGKLCAELKARGAYWLTLEVRASNAGAAALYGSLGFTEIGRRPRYYQRPTEDARILRKEL